MQLSSTTSPHSTTTPKICTPIISNNYTALPHSVVFPISSPRSKYYKTLSSSKKRVHEEIDHKIDEESNLHQEFKENFDPCTPEVNRKIVAYEEEHSLSKKRRTQRQEISYSPTNCISVLDVSTPKRSRDSLKQDVIFMENDNLNFNINSCLETFYKFSNHSLVIDTWNLQTLLVALRFESLFSLDFLLFVYSCSCESKFRINAEEWVHGMRKLSCYTIEQLMTKLPQIKSQYCCEWRLEQYKSFFSFVFRYIRDSPQSRSIDTFIVCNLLKAITRGTSFASVAFLFVEFLSRCDIKCLNLDQWKTFVDFAASISTTSNDTSMHDDAWPSIYDRFLEWYKTKFGL